MKLVIENLGGYCPVQGEGTLEDKWNWYFRARHDYWEFILEPLGTNPLANYFSPKQATFYRKRYWGKRGGHEAGYMPLQEAVNFIGRCCVAFLERQEHV